MADNGRILQIFRDGRRTQAREKIQLPTGAEANFYTLNEAAKIVREDSKFPDLRNFAFREIIGLEKQTIAERMDAAFFFARTTIVYELEKSGFETLADLWSAMYAINAEYPKGDCMIKSVALATCLRYLNLTPYFIAVRQVPNVTWFNHVYLGVMTQSGEIVLDPTPPEYRLGEEGDYLQKIIFPIFR